MRMVERRRNVRNTHGYNRRREDAGLWSQPTLLNLCADLLLLFAIAALGWAAMRGVSSLPYFNIREVILSAQPQHISLAQLEHVARTRTGGNFFTVDLDAARSAFEQLPWVRKATLQRRWPDKLQLLLEEHEAAALWLKPGSENEQMRLVNSHGELFDADLPAQSPPLPQIIAPAQATAAMLRRHNEFAAELASINRRVESLTLTPRQALRLVLDAGAVLELGREEDNGPLAMRIQRFTEHYEQVRARLGELRVADMRYPNGFTWVGVTPPPGAATANTPS